MKKLLLLIALMLSSQSFAGGSASSEYILGLLTLETQMTLKTTFDLDDQGSCLRMGRHTETPGLRILPCTIEGKMIGTDIYYIIELDTDENSDKGVIYSINLAD